MHDHLTAGNLLILDSDMPVQNLRNIGKMC